MSEQKPAAMRVEEPAAMSETKPAVTVVIPAYQ